MEFSVRVGDDFGDDVALPSPRVLEDALFEAPRVRHRLIQVDRLDRFRPVAGSVPEQVRQGACSPTTNRPKQVLSF